MSRCIIAACLLVAASLPASAADNWTYAASDHFEVYTTGGDGRAREALAYFERVHAFFTDFLKLSPRTSTPTRLIVFSNDRQFAPYRPNEVAVAFYLGGQDRDYIVMKSLDEDSFRIVVHEYAHLIIRHSGGVYPVWLNEGLAEFFSTMEAEGKRMGVGKPPEHHLRYLTDGVALIDMNRLLSVGRSSPEYNTRTHVGTFYAQSWALTHMLMTDRRYSPGTGTFMELVLGGMPGGAAIEKAYGKTPDVVGRDLFNYIRQSQYVYFLADYKSPASGPRVPTRPADAFEAELVTTNLLADSRDRETVARASFERLAAQRPDDLLLLESRAYFELRRGHGPEALSYLRRAVERGSKNASVYRDHALLDPQQAEGLLATAISLAPEDVDLRLRYAAALLGRSKSAEVLAALKEVKAVPLESVFRLSLLLANAYAQLNRMDEARAAAAQAARYADPGDEATIAAGLIESLDEFAARRAAAEASRTRPAAPVRQPPPADVSPDGPTRSSSSAPELGIPGQGQPFVVTGRLRNIVSCAEAPILEIATPAGTVRLVIDAPLAITVLGTKDGMVDLQCGAQDVAIRVGYVPAVDPARKTVGRVRLLDYRPQ